MRTIPILATPNQSFAVTIDGVRWVLSIKSTNHVMIADIYRDGVLLLSGSRILAGEAIIPYQYLQSGNFLLLTISDTLPDFRVFGVSQLLVYLSRGEIATMPAVSVGEVFAAARTTEYLTTDDGFYLTTDTGSLLTDD